MNTRPDQVTRPPVPPPAERLVNLTPHQIVLQAAELPDEEATASAADQTTMRLAPEGQFTRVDDDTSRLGQSWLNAGTGLVTVTGCAGQPSSPTCPHRRREPGWSYPK